MRFVRFLRSSKAQTSRPIISNAPIATPTPIPAFAPVERPLDLSDEDGELGPEVEVEEEEAVAVPKACWYCRRGAEAGWKTPRSESSQATVTARISRM